MVDTNCHYGTFKTINLDKRLQKNIQYVKTTPIQRKIMPKILADLDCTGIARTGSGKTYAFLVPIIQKILTKSTSLEITDDKTFVTDSIILVPTRELALQIYKITKLLTRKCGIMCAILHGGSHIKFDFPKLKQKQNIIISTVGRLKHIMEEMKIKIKTDIICLDEMDRIFEEKTMKDSLDILLTNVKYSQSIFFSATLPENVIPYITNTEIVKIDDKMSEIDNYFFYVHTAEKEKALMVMLDRLKGKKTMVFVGTKYTAEYLSEIIEQPNVKIYSSMDQQAREENMTKFMRDKKNCVNVLIVTDLAARGLDIKNLDSVILYDLCDDKTFLHRIGRVGRCGRKGESFSLVSYDDIYLYYNIRDTHFKDMEIGKIPQQVLDTKIVKQTELKRIAENGDIKMKAFRRKLHVESKDNVMEYKVHSYFGGDGEKEELIRQIRNYGKKESETNENKTEISGFEENKYKDQFYISYTNKDNKSSLYYSAYTVPNDRKEKDQAVKKHKKRAAGEQFAKWQKKSKTSTVNKR